MMLKWQYEDAEIEANDKLKRSQQRRHLPNELKMYKF